MNQTDSCPICLNEKDKENFKLLEHFDDQDGDVSSHKMCNACYNTYKEKTKCPFCNLKLKVSFEDSGMDEVDYQMHMTFGNMTDEEIARKNINRFNRFINRLHSNILNFARARDEPARATDQPTDTYQFDSLRYLFRDL